MPEPIIRPYRPEDEAAFLSLVHDLAVFGDHEPPDADACARLAADARAADPPFHVLLAHADDHVVGYALYFAAYSTFKGRASMHLEDMYVVADERGHGVGLALFEAVLAEARARGCCRVEWSAPAHLTGATAFYRARGARHLHEWQLFRIEGDALDAH